MRANKSLKQAKLLGFYNYVERPQIPVGVSKLKFSQGLRDSECRLLIILFMSWGK